MRGVYKREWQEKNEAADINGTCLSQNKISGVLFYPEKFMRRTRRIWVKFIVTIGWKLWLLFKMTLTLDEHFLNIPKNAHIMFVE